MMRIYARIRDGHVAELFETDADISKLFHPDLAWVDITDESLQPKQGWLFDGKSFKPAPTGPTSGW